MQLKCLNCGGTHESTAEMRECYRVKSEPSITPKQLAYLGSLVADRVVPDGVDGGSLETLTKRDAGNLISQLLTQPFKPKGEGVPASIPDARYAFMNDEGNPVFFRVKTSKTNGVRYVDRVLGSPGDFRYVKMSKTAIARCINKIKDDPALYSMMFGVMVGYCGVCGSPLTDPNSIAMGIGPVCAVKYDW
jgi:hypothetical protein